MESSSILVCSAMKRTQKQDLCTSGGQLECEKAGLRSTGLLLLSDSSSVDSDCITTAGPWIWQLPLNGPPSTKLHMHNTILLVVMLYFLVVYQHWINWGSSTTFTWLWTVNQVGLSHQSRCLPIGLPNTDATSTP